MPTVTIGIDLAKNPFTGHGMDETGKAMMIRPRVPRDRLVILISQLPACLIGMEACSAAHHWARVFQKHGHTVKLMAPNLVAPYRMTGKRGKYDAADAAAICEAVTRPGMRFVPLKDEHQQATLCLHRTRQGFVEERAATYNRLRGLLPEFGVVLPQRPEKLRRHITGPLDTLPGWAKRSISDLLEHAGNIEERLVEYDRAIAGIAREDARSKRLMQLRGIAHRSRHCCSAARGRHVFCARQFKALPLRAAVDVQTFIGPASPSMASPLDGRRPEGVGLMKYLRKKRIPTLDITLAIVFVVCLVFTMMMYNAITEMHQQVPENASGITASAASTVAAATAAANAAVTEAANRSKAASQ